VERLGAVHAAERVEELVEKPRVEEVQNSCRVNEKRDFERKSADTSKPSRLDFEQDDEKTFERIIDIDYRCDKRRFWLSAHNCQFPTPTSQNLELEQQIRILGAD
jgi:hypothetical protein